MEENADGINTRDASRMLRAVPEQRQGGVRLGGVATGHHSHCVIIVEARGPH